MSIHEKPRMFPYRIVLESVCQYKMCATQYDKRVGDHAREAK